VHRAARVCPPLSQHCAWYALCLPQGVSTSLEREALHWWVASIVIWISIFDCICYTGLGNMVLGTMVLGTMVLGNIVLSNMVLGIMVRGTGLSYCQCKVHNEEAINHPISHYRCMLKHTKRFPV